MPDIVATLLDLTTNWPATYFQTVLPSCDLAADHRERERGDGINTPECSDKAIRWRLRSVAAAAAGLALADEERLSMLLNLEE